MGDLIIGTDDCPYHMICKAFESEEGYLTISNDWPKLAGELKIRQSTIEKISKDLLKSKGLEKRTLLDVPKLLLLEWKVAGGQNATLKKLIDILDGPTLKWKAVSDKLRDYLRQCHHLCSSFPNIYVSAPEGYRTLIEKDLKVVIICTPNVKNTIRKITENASKLMLHSSEEFFAYISMVHEGSVVKSKILVVNCEEKLDSVLEGVCKFDGKVCIVTPGHTQTVNNLSRKWIEKLNSKVKICVDITTWADIGIESKIKIKSEICRIYGTNVATKLVHVLQQPAPGDHCETEKILLALINRKDPHLFRETLPAPLSIYVHRKLRTRNSIATAAFQKRTSDVFIFRDIELTDLCRCTGISASEVATSGTLIKHRNTTSRFILLDGQQPKHFEEICKLLAPSGKPVHLLSQKKGKFTWIKSQGNIETIQSCVDEGSQTTIHETDFLENIVSQKDLASKAVVISDLAGMGMSVLLQHIGRNLKNKFPDRLVVFVNIESFVAGVKSKLGYGTACIADAVLGQIQEVSCKSTFAGVYLKHLLQDKQSRLNLELLLDGFDEIMQKDLSTAYKVITKILSSFKSIRLWTTTRPNYLHSVEKQLGVLGYNIEPFSKSDQLAFLASYWKTGNETDIKLNDIADMCLNSFLEISNEAEQIAGIPLQCMLIGEVYKKDVQNHCHLENSLPYSPPAYGLTNLYEKFVNVKIEIADRKYHVLKYVTRDEIVQALKYFSFQLIFPDDIKTFVKQTPTTVARSQMRHVGILKQDGAIVLMKQPQFIHHTFAEYFVALTAAEVINAQSDENDNIHFSFLDTILQTIPTYCTTGNIFRKSSIDRGSELCDFIVPQFTSITLTDFLNDYIKKFPSTIFKNINRIKWHWFMAAKACVYHNYIYIFNFMENIVPQKHKRELYDNHFLLLCFRNGNYDFIKNIDHDILKFALNSGNWEFSNYVMYKNAYGSKAINKLYLENQDYLNLVVGDSKGKSEEVVDNKINMLRFLQQTHPTLFRIQRWTMTVLSDDYFYVGVHEKLMLEIIKLFYETHQQPSLPRRILWDAMLSYSSIQFETFLEKFVEIVSSHELQNYRGTIKELINYKDRFGRDLLHGIIYKFEPTERTLDLFEKFGADFSVEYKGETLIKHAIRIGSSVTFLRRLLKRLSGEADKNGDTFLHKACKLDKVELAGFKRCVEEFGLDAFLKNSRGETPLYLYVKNDRSPHREVLTYIMDEVIKEDVGRLREFLSYAIKLKNWDFIEFILELHSTESMMLLNVFDFAAGSSVELEVQTLVEWAIRSGRRETLLKKLVRLFGQPEDILYKPDKNGDTLLHKACRRNYVVQEGFKCCIVELGLDAFLKNNKGETPLYLYVKHDRYPVSDEVEYIMKNVIKNGAGRLREFLSHAIELTKMDLIQCILKLHDEKSIAQRNALPPDYINAIEEARKFYLTFKKN